ncbi:MAG: hypothetical protein BJ554DRAFT_618 [Olpidium bornovanus]|uniref:Uncharacterized protein n=1 Tax=Olpidium bornovanus TaxID=278681 RepID=A0A8H8DLY4_9FUNG|nr:MAG: hypothetical protein BJ554DRAFT_618 [Olpidium bornovanus]
MPPGVSLRSAKNPRGLRRVEPLEIRGGAGEGIGQRRQSASDQVYRLVPAHFRAISIFISASSGHRFLTEFIEIGGVLTVLEALNMPKVREADKTEALKLLLHIVNAGRKYKEFIGESYGIRAVIDCLARSKSDVTQDYAGAVLHALGSDNLRFQQTVYKALMATLTSTSVADANSQKVAGEVAKATKRIIGRLYHGPRAAFHRFHPPLCRGRYYQPAEEPSHGDSVRR